MAVCVYLKFSMESRLVEKRSCLAVVITAVRCIGACGAVALLLLQTKKTADVVW